MVGWRGPHHDVPYHSLVTFTPKGSSQRGLQDFEQISALRVMWQYLTDSAVSPLQKALVDTPEPFCSDLSTFFYENSVFLQVASSFLEAFSEKHLTRLLSAPPQVCPF